MRPARALCAGRSWPAILVRVSPGGRREYTVHPHHHDCAPRARGSGRPGGCFRGVFCSRGAFSRVFRRLAVRIAGVTPKPSTLDELIGPRLAAQLDALDVRSNRVFSGKLQGERRSKKRGQSVEFDEHRQYAPGDDVRFIDWKVLARLDRLFVKLFLEEQDLALHVVVDASASMDAGLAEGDGVSKRKVAAEVAMALGYIGLMKQNRVGVSVFGKPGRAGIARLPDMRGRQQVQRLAQHLMDEVFAGPGESWSAGDVGVGLNEALRSIAAQRVGKGVMVVLSDFMPSGGEGRDGSAYEAGLRALAAARGYDTYCVQVVSEGELDPEVLQRGGGVGVSGDVRLTDVESGRVKEVTVTAALVRRYRRAVEGYIEGLRRFCRSREMDHVLVRTDEDVSKLVMETLRRRGVVG